MLSKIGAVSTGALILAALLSIGLSPALASTGPICLEGDADIGACVDSAQSNDGAVTIGGTIEGPGSTNSGADGIRNPKTRVSVSETEDESWCVLPRIPCLMPDPVAATASGPITTSDIATFRPQAPTAGMQPNQWMIVGLDTNFYATASTHIVDGTLFGGTAQVRFTPVSYRWDYGDGSTATLSNAGTTWAKYKIAEFDPTPTSHIYNDAGNYTITLAVTYAAEYRVAGSSWRSVLGSLTIIAPPLNATAGHATTVLVDQDCNTNPNGIGC